MAQNQVYLIKSGDGSFTDVAGESNLSGGIAKTTALVSSDLNNNRDVDFFLINFGASNQLFNNMRDGTFKPVQDLTMAGHGTGLGLGAGDINRTPHTLYIKYNIMATRGQLTGAVALGGKGNLAAQGHNKSARHAHR